MIALQSLGWGSLRLRRSQLDHALTCFKELLKQLLKQINYLQSQVKQPLPFFYYSNHIKHPNNSHHSIKMRAAFFLCCRPVSSGIEGEMISIMMMMMIMWPAYRVLGWEAVGGGPHRWMAISCMTYHQWAGPLVPRGHGPRPREAQWVNLKVFDIEGPSFEQGPCLSIYLSITKKNVQREDS